jgi:hypothetical protein
MQRCHYVKRCGERQRNSRNRNSQAFEHEAHSRDRSLTSRRQPAPRAASMTKCNRRGRFIVPIRTGYSRCVRQRACPALFNDRGLCRSTLSIASRR